MFSSDRDGNRRKMLKRSLSKEEECITRIPPESEKLFENLPWVSIMTDIALTAAVAELKVYKFLIFVKYFKNGGHSPDFL